MGGLLEPVSRGYSESRSRHCTPAWAPERDCLKNKQTNKKTHKISQSWWQVPVIPATQEAEAGELLEPGRRRLQ